MPPPHPPHPTQKNVHRVPKKGEQQDSVLSAFDFATTRSKKDRELLWEAKYGNRNPDGKMSPEQCVPYFLWLFIGGGDGFGRRSQAECFLCVTPSSPFQ